MMSKIETRRINTIYRLISGNYQIEFDTVYGKKLYPFSLALHGFKFNDDIIKELESSKIIKVDTDFNFYCDRSNISVLYIVPQAFYDTDKFTEVIYTLLQKLIGNQEPTD